MKRPEADWRELARAVDRVRRVDASVERTLHELRRVSRRQLVTTGAALGLGVAALATLTTTGKKTHDGRPPVKASSRRPIVGGLLATLAPWMLDAAVRSLSLRPARAAVSARDRLDTERRNSRQPSSQGEPQ
jgi:uncharacterized membrane protein YbhN (UPF0104 family)